MSKKQIQNCLIVVPMKDPITSKTRLSEALRPQQRETLAKLLFERTLDVLQQAQTMMGDHPFSIAVVSDSSAAREIAKNYGVALIDEDDNHSLSGATNAAAHWAGQKGFDALCILPADLAAPQAKEICQFISYGMMNEQAVVCPSSDMGTNAIFVFPPAAIKFSYGKNSATRHCKILEQAGYRPIIMPLDSLKFDIDTCDCLQHASNQNDDLKTIIEAL